MPQIELPDGHRVVLPEGEPIGSIFPPTAIVARFDGELVDLSFVSGRDGKGEPVTADEPDGLHVLRHSTAHVMAQAVCDLVPGAKYAIGPPIEDGFYYDFELPQPLTPDDLPRIEARMAEIGAADQPFVREELSRQQALERFADQPYKREIIEGLDEAEGAGADTVVVYRSGEWSDLCRGPHVPSTGRLGAFKLLKLAGAYWRGDESRPMLQRIYGTAWPTERELKAYLHRVEEAERRDHRKLGRQLDLFSFPEELGPGLAVWHQRGGIFRKQLEDYVRDLHLERGYDLVVTPHLARRGLWDTSGHTAKFIENMYPVMDDGQGSQYFVKPMNCPFHVLVYKSQVRSYRDLPMRLSELGTVYRYERAGVLHGLLRVRGMTQDDAHIFCMSSQIEAEVEACIDFAYAVMKNFGFDKFEVELSDWDAKHPENYAGKPEDWHRATAALAATMKKMNIRYKTITGEAAFYGPKIDVKLIDAIGRSWQLTTVQFDFNLPARFGLQYVADDGAKHQPLMVHRALLGSVERFFGILIEHYAGAFPLWLAPVQVEICPVSEKVIDYAKHVHEMLKNHGVRVHLDDRNEKLPAKIRDAQLQKIPYMLVVGAKEAEAGTVSIRHRSKGDLGPKPLAEFIEALQREVDSRATS